MKHSFLFNYNKSHIYNSQMLMWNKIIRILNCERVFKRWKIHFTLWIYLVLNIFLFPTTSMILTLYRLHSYEIKHYRKCAVMDFFIEIGLFGTVLKIICHFFLKPLTKYTARHSSQIAIVEFILETFYICEEYISTWLPFIKNHIK